MQMQVKVANAGDLLEGAAQHDMSQGRRGQAEQKLVIARAYRREEPIEHEIHAELGRGREEG